MTGLFHRSLDDKQRFAIPKPLRDAMGPSDNAVLYVAPGTDGSLEVYTEKCFERLSSELHEAPRNDRHHRAFSRVFYSQVQRVEMDRQGRVRLPLELSRFASISKDVVLIGVRDHMEVWDRERWEGYFSVNQSKFDELAGSVTPAGAVDGPA